MSYDNTDSGALFKNDKRGNEKAPDYTGDIYDANGKKRRIAAWLRQSAKGTNYLSLKVEDVRDIHKTQPTEQPKDHATENPSGGDPYMDKIPFNSINSKTP